MFRISTLAFFLSAMMTSPFTFKRRKAWGEHLAEWYQPGQSGSWGTEARSSLEEYGVQVHYKDGRERKDDSEVNIHLRALNTPAFSKL